MDSGDQISEQGFATLDRLCVTKLQTVSFGAYNQSARIVQGIQHALTVGVGITVPQRLALYRLCWRFRKQLDDTKLIARTLIAAAVLEELVDVERREVERPRVRAWRAAAPVVDLFGGRP